MRRFITLTCLIFCSVICFSQSVKLDPTFGIHGFVRADMGSPFSYNSAASQVLTGPGDTIYILFNNPTFISKRFPDGSVDSSYGLNGYSNSLTFNNGYAALQPDGKIVIAGSGFNIARMKTNGTPDSSFGVNATEPGFDENSSAASVAIQSDGKIVVAGIYTNGSDNYFAVARYNTNGDPDITFNDSGRVITDFGFKIPPEHGERDSTPVHDQAAKSVVIQPDGKIIAGGYATNGFDMDFAIARYDSNGHPDSTFDNDGLQTTNFGEADNGNALAIQTDGKIVLAGYLYDGTGNDIGITRYKINGSTDSSFGVDGRQSAGLNLATQTGLSMALQTNGKMVVASSTFAGNADNDFKVVRFNTNGSPDNTFDGDGAVTTDFSSSDDYLTSMVLQSDGKILAAGYSYTYLPGNVMERLAVSRYNTNGSLDNSFAVNGKIIGIFNQGSTAFTTHAIQTDGKIVAAGQTWNGNDYDFAVARYTADGKRDSTFNGNGFQTTDFGGTDGAVSMIIQPDGKIVVAGNSDNRFALARYNADGSPDNSFNGTGTLTTHLAFADVCQSVAMQQDGKIVMAGFSFSDPGFNSASFSLARINANGTPDDTFNGDGKQFTDFGSHEDFASSVAIQNDGKIVLAGRSYIDNHDNFSVARYNTDGTLDTTFSQDGMQTNSFGPDDYFAAGMAIQSDGKIVLGGNSESSSSPLETDFVVARYTANGDLDTTFNGAGFQATSLGSHFNFGKCVAINVDGRIAVGGTNDNFAIVLYNSNGKPDSTFGSNGILTTDIAVGGSSIESISFLDNKIYAVGDGQFPGDLGVIARYLLPEGGALPVSLLDFDAVLQNKSVLLQWKIATEKNLSNFVIERGADGSRFNPIGSVASKGATVFTRDYSTIDKQPLTGVNFYRLKMVDIDGKFAYSNVVAVRLDADIKLRIFPNPVQRTLFVEADGNNENALVQIFDASGRKLKELKVFLSGATSFSLDITGFANGFYNLVLNKAGKTEVKAFIKR